MTVEDNRGDSDNFENFGVGLRVLAVDDDPTCLRLLETLLKKCQYHVTTTSQAIVALQMLKENKDRFDLVISDVHMPDMDGFKLLEYVGLEMDLPLIMLSANGDPKLVLKGVTHGACDYLVKPVRIEELRNIWQHVIRRKKIDSRKQTSSNDRVKSHDASGEVNGSPMAGNADLSGKFSRKRKDESEDNRDDSEDPGTQKKPRVVWSMELHRKFVSAVNQLGIEKAVPKRILDLMNVEGLTLENVATHLQKYRLYMKKISSVATQQANMVAAPGIKDSPLMRMGSLDGLGDFRSLAGTGRLANTAVSPYSTNGMLGRLNSPSNLNLRNHAPPSPLQPTHNPITGLGKIHPVLSHGGQNPSLFQGIPSSQNKCNFNGMDDSKLLGTGTGFTGSPNNLLNGIQSNPMMLRTQQTLSGGGYGNQSNHNMGSFNSGSFNTGVTGSSNLLDPRIVESSKLQPNSLLSTEVFQGQLPMNGTPRENSSLNVRYSQNNSVKLSSSNMGSVPLNDSKGGQSQVPNQSWVDHSRNYGHVHSSNNRKTEGTNRCCGVGAATTSASQTPLLTPIRSSPRFTSQVNAPSSPPVPRRKNVKRKLVSEENVVERQIRNKKKVSKLVEEVSGKKWPKKNVKTGNTKSKKIKITTEDKEHEPTLAEIQKNGVLAKKGASTTVENAPMNETSNKEVLSKLGNTSGVVDLRGEFGSGFSGIGFFGFGFFGFG